MGTPFLSRSLRYSISKVELVQYRVLEIVLLKYLFGIEFLLILSVLNKKKSLSPVTKPLFILQKLLNLYPSILAGKFVKLTEANSL